MSKSIRITKSVSKVISSGDSNTSGQSSSSLVLSNLQQVTDRGSETNHVLSAAGFKAKDVLVIPAKAPAESLLKEGEVSLYFTLLPGAGATPPPVVDLTNYYIKSAVDALIATAESNSKSYTNTAIGNIATFDIVRVSSLPTAGVAKTIYLVPKTGTTNDAYDEFLYVDSAWEHIGSTDVNLTNYYTKSEIGNLLSGKEPSISSDETSKYWNGQKSWTDFATSVRSSVLSGLTVIANTAITAGDTILSALGKLQAQITSLSPVSSERSFSSGTFIQTSITSAVTTPFLLKIEGNAYSSFLPLEIVLQGCLTTAETIVNCSAIGTGQELSDIRAFIYNGHLCFWFAVQGPYQGFNVKCFDVTGPNGYKNKVTAITDYAKPAVSTEVIINITQSYNSRNSNNNNTDWAVKKLTATKVSTGVLELPTAAPAASDMESGKIYLYYNNL